MPDSTTWRCPVDDCDVEVEVPVVVARQTLDGVDYATVSLPPTALAEVFAHAWTHTDGATSQ